VLGAKLTSQRHDKYYLDVAWQVDLMSAMKRRAGREDDSK
jgi:hypothetical protein